MTGYAAAEDGSEDGVVCIQADCAYELKQIAMFDRENRRLYEAEAY